MMTPHDFYIGMKVFLQIAIGVFSGLLALSIGTWLIKLFGLD
jgi:hypothetical protein